jgi:predicted nucleotidyltransferase
MVKTTSDAIELIKKFRTVLEENAIPVRRAILFGSFANETNDEWSDIDVAFVSEAFSGNRYSDNQKVRHLKLQVDSSISLLPYRPEDFDPSDLFVSEIIKTGIVVV